MGKASFAAVSSWAARKCPISYPPIVWQTSVNTLLDELHDPSTLHRRQRPVTLSTKEVGQQIVGLTRRRRIHSRRCKPAIPVAPIQLWCTHKLRGARVRRRRFEIEQFASQAAVGLYSWSWWLRQRRSQLNGCKANGTSAGPLSRPSRLSSQKKHYL